MCAYAEARNTNFDKRNNNEPSASQMKILSIGTGGGCFEINNKRTINRWSLLKWAKLLPDIMLDGSVDTVAFQLNEIYESLNSNKSESYLRINPPKNNIKVSSDFSDASPENISNLLKAGEKTVEYAIANGLNKFLDNLID
jgi:hypothetical protein